MGQLGQWAGSQETWATQFRNPKGSVLQGHYFPTPGAYPPKPLLGVHHQCTLLQWESERQINAGLLQNARRTHSPTLGCHLLLPELWGLESHLGGRTCTHAGTLAQTPQHSQSLTWDAPWAPRVPVQGGFRRAQDPDHWPAGLEAAHRSGQNGASNPGRCTARRMRVRQIQ